MIFIMRTLQRFENGRGVITFRTELDVAHGIRTQSLSWRLIITEANYHNV